MLKPKNIRSIYGKDLSIIVAFILWLLMLRLRLIMLGLMYNVKAGDAEPDPGCHDDEPSQRSQRRVSNERYIASELSTLPTGSFRRPEVAGDCGHTLPPA